LAAGTAMLMVMAKAIPRDWMVRRLKTLLVRLPQTHQSGSMPADQAPWWTNLMLWSSIVHEQGYCPMMHLTPEMLAQTLLCLSGDPAQMLLTELSDTYRQLIQQPLPTTPLWQIQLQLSPVSRAALLPAVTLAKVTALGLWQILMTAELGMVLLP
jgi:hypothetical protein